MTKQVQRRRGTATQHTSFTGAEGELSVNTTNKSVHVHDGSTAGGIELARKDGSNVAFTSGTLDGVTIGGSTAGAGTFTNLTATGTTTLAGASTSANITFGDNDKAIFGAGSDLQIYHDGSNSYIKDAGTGNLFIDAANYLTLRNTNGESYLAAQANGYVRLYYNGSQKLATTSTGIDVTGNATFADNGKAIFGAGSDLQIYHDGTHSRIYDTGTGNLILQGSSAIVFNAVTNGEHGRVTDGGGWALGYSGTTKLATTSTGIDVTGTVTADGLIFDQNFANPTNSTATVYNQSGVGPTISGYKNEFRTGSTPVSRLEISNNGDISFYEDTGTTAKFFWDASAERLGIGTSSPAATLHVEGNAQVNGYIFQNNGTNAIGLWGEGNADMRFGTNNSEKMRLNSSGNLLFGQNAVIGQNTSDGSDNRGVWLCGGGSQTVARGGSVRVYGNEHTDTGDVQIYSGNNAASNITLNAYGSNSTIQFTTNGGGEKMRITSDGKVGIGDSNPDTKLHVEELDSGNSKQLVSLVNPGGNAGSGARLWLSGTNATTRGAYIEGQSRSTGNNHDMIFATSAVSSAPTERMRIDSSGNVGIGTSSPSSALEIKRSSGSGSTQLHIHNDKTGDAAQIRLEGGRTSTNDAAQIVFANRGNVGAGIRMYSGADEGELRFYTSASGSGSAISERMRIDSSGNLLVGKTSANTYNTTAGFEAIPGGLTTSTRDGAIALILNRLTSDGDIAVFRKDGTTVGSIGVNGGTPYLVKTTGGVQIGNGGLNPVNSTGGLTDGVYQLGASNARYTNLYLSGGVYLGGTGSANKLDDYEEGTWTLGTNTGVTLSAASAASGRYTKVGRLVTLTCLITPSSVTSSSTYFDITGLPFGSGSVTNANAVGTAMSQYTLPKESQLVTFIANGTAVLRLYESDTGAWKRLQHSDISTSSDIYVTITYEAA